MKKSNIFGAIVLMLGMGSAFAAEITVKMNIVNEQGLGAEIGHIVVSESEYGLVFTPKLEKLPAGLHGFHVHENPSCAPKEINAKIVPAGAAGGHLDPKATKKHGLPWTNDNHLGDLPALTFSADGFSTNPVLAPRLKMDDLKGRSLMVHVGGDNHSDHPAPLGGGGARMACGVI